MHFEYLMWLIRNFDGLLMPTFSRLNNCHDAIMNLWAMGLHLSVDYHLFNS